MVSNKYSFSIIGKSFILEVAYFFGLCSFLSMKKVVYESSVYVALVVCCLFS